jgi:hypothetical protein
MGSGGRFVSRSCCVSATLLVLLAAGCVSSGISREELPVEPIALLYWEAEEARRRAELQEQNTGSAASREGVARVEALGELLGGGDSQEWAALSRYPGHLCLLDPRTLKVERVEAAPAGARPMGWSPDRRRLLFASAHRGRTNQLYEYDRDTGEVRSVTRGKVPHAYGDYGGKGRIGFAELRVAGADLGIDLHVTEPGESRSRVVARGELAESMRLSPDGDFAVYVRHIVAASSGRARGEPVELVLLPLDSAEGELAEARVLGRGRYPTFTPDSQWIVYSGPWQGGWRLRRVRVDGSARSPVGRGSRDEKWPAVSPDGRFVVYVADSGGLDRLFVRRFDGSGDRILLDEGAVAIPVW